MPQNTLIPGITDTDDNLRAMVDFLKMRCGEGRTAGVSPVVARKEPQAGHPRYVAGQRPGIVFKPAAAGSCRQVFLDAGIRV